MPPMTDATAWDEFLRQRGETLRSSLAVSWAWLGGLVVAFGACVSLLLTNAEAIVGKDATLGWTCALALIALGSAIAKAGIRAILPGAIQARQVKPHALPEQDVRPMYARGVRHVGVSWSIMLDDDLSSVLVLGVLGWEILHPHGWITQFASVYVAVFFGFTLLSRLWTAVRLSPQTQGEMIAFVASQKTRWPTAARSDASQGAISSSLTRAAAPASVTARLHIIAIITAVPLVAYIVWLNFAPAFQVAVGLRAASAIVAASALTFTISTMFIRAGRNRTANLVEALRYRVRGGLNEALVQPTFEIIETYAWVPLLRRFTIGDAIELAEELRAARENVETTAS